jgi:hypothetical protein
MKKTTNSSTIESLKKQVERIQSHPALIPREQLPGRNVPYDTTLNVYQRLRAVRQVVSYLPKHDTGQGFKGIRHDELIDKCRDQFIEFGLDWTLRRMVPLDGGGWMEKTGRDGQAYQICHHRYLCTFMIVNIDTPSEYVEVVTVGEGLDWSDKGCGKAATYAEKTALAKLLNLRTGDDPDFMVSDPNGKLDEPDPHRAKLVAQILDLAKGRSTDPQTEINRVLVNMREMYTSARRIRSIHEVPIDQLQKWAEKWTEEDTSAPKPKKKTKPKKKPKYQSQIWDGLVDLATQKLAEAGLHDIDREDLDRCVTSFLHQFHRSIDDLDDTEVQDVMLQRAKDASPDQWNQWLITATK